MLQPLRYSLAIPDPSSHLLQVQLRVPTAGLGDAVDLAMPAWCPGSYLIRDYARFLRNLSITDGEGGPRRFRKSDKQTWRVERGGAEELIVRYEVYGHDLSVRTNHVDASHAFVHGPATFLYCEALRDRRVELAVEAPEDGAGRAWHVATSLEPSPTADLRPGVRRFEAADIDELFDSPLHLGATEVRRFSAGGVPVELAVWGEVPPGGACNLDDLVADLPAIMEGQASWFGGTMPFPRYTFILMLSHDAYGGLEHKSSSANLSAATVFATRKSYEGMLELLSHEFFHAWNGKRMAPPTLHRFDYSREAYTRCLWVVEGITSYYDRLNVRLTGRMSAKSYLEKLVDEWARMLATPGRRLQSLEEASFDAWIKLYKPDESNLNTTVSYYLKGGLVATALDLEVRRRSERRHRLADVLALLWRELGARGLPYPEEIEPLFERATGLSLTGFFDHNIRGTDDPDLAGELLGVGLELRSQWERVPEPGRLGEGVPVWLGATTVPGGGTVKVTGVLDGTPAQRGGLSPGDEVVALDGLRVASDADLRQRLAARLPGDAVEVALFRRNRLLALPIAIEKSPPTKLEIAPVAEPTAVQRAAYQDWLGEAFPEPTGAGTPAPLATVATVGRWI